MVAIINNFCLLYLKSAKRADINYFHYIHSEYSVFTIFTTLLTPSPPPPSLKKAPKKMAAMRKMINFLWENNQIKKENRKKKSLCGRPFPMFIVHLYYTLTRPQSREMKLTFEKKLASFFRHQHCNSMINIFFFISYKGLHSPKTCLYMHN